MGAGKWGGTDQPVVGSMITTVASSEEGEIVRVNEVKEPGDQNSERIVRVEVTGCGESKEREGACPQD